MSAHNYQQFSYSREKGVVTLYAAVAIGSSGAPTLVAKQNQGIQSVVRNSAGNYTITLGQPASGSQVAQTDKFQRLLGVGYISLVAGGITAAPTMSIVNDLTASAGTLQIQFSAPTSSSVTTLVAADPASGETILLEIQLKNSTV